VREEGWWHGREGGVAMRKATAMVQSGGTAHLGKDCEGVGVDVAIERV
jgi:hypothetical protein